MAHERRIPDDERVVSDPRVIRALTHPARLTVLEELANGAELTATECARVTGLSASAMSYHLRALEKYGFVERVTGTDDGRERPWRATSPGGWRIDGPSGVALQHATNALVAAMFDRVMNEFAQWEREESEQPEQWRDAATMSNSVLWLTPEEARELTDSYYAITRRVKGRTRANHPDGARRVRLTTTVVPTPE